jgi:AcrR family transcriptional regulator
MTTAGKTDPRHARRTAKQAAILIESWALAQRDGLAAVSLHNVAAAVGLRQPSLYVYFGSKLALYDAMFADGYRQLLDYFAAHDYTGEPRDALVRFLADTVKFSGDDIVRHQMLFQRTIPGFEPSPESWSLALEFYEKASNVIKAAGIEDPADLDLFTALTNGMAHQQVANDPGGTRWVDHAERAVDMLLASAARGPHPAARAQPRRSQSRPAEHAKNTTALRKGNP